MAVGLFGKLPARGDFLTVGLTPEVVDVWDGTLTAMTAGSEAQLGAAWAGLWDSAPSWCFWIGSGSEAGPCAGVLRPSRDRVGRRYPLLLLADGAQGLPAPPVIDDADSRDWFAALLNLSDTLFTATSADNPADILTEMTDPPQVIPAPDDTHAAFFAEAEGGPKALLAEAGPHDHGLAAARRSYWWAVNAQDKVVLMALEGLPDPSMAAALLQSAAHQSPTDTPQEPATVSASTDPSNAKEMAPTDSPEQDLIAHAADHSPFDGAAPPMPVNAASDAEAVATTSGDESPFGDAPEPQRPPGLASRFRRRH